MFRSKILDIIFSIKIMQKLKQQLHNEQFYCENKCQLLELETAQISQKKTPQKIHNRARNNWSKVRLMLLKSKKYEQNLSGYASLNEKQMKNNTYNLFQKQISTKTKYLQTHFQQQKHCLQQMLQIIYLFEIKFPKNYGKANSEEYVDQTKGNLTIQNDPKPLRIITYTPIPTVGKILQASSNSRILHLKDHAQSRMDEETSEINKTGNSYNLKQRCGTSNQRQHFHQEIKNNLKQIDTTGFWIWQAEQIMTYFLIKNVQEQLNQLLLSKKNETGPNITGYRLNLLNSKRILQIGAGSSGLAALTLHKLVSEIKQTSKHGVVKQSKQVLSILTQKSSLKTLITDGKIENIKYLENNILMSDFSMQRYNQGNNVSQSETNPFISVHKSNQGQQSANLNQSIKNKTEAQSVHINTQVQFTHKQIQAQLMLWGTVVNDKYDVILSGDCLFFEQFHPQLIETLKRSMHNQSVAIFVNPRRGNSMTNFVNLAEKQGFSVSWIDFRDQKFIKQQKRVSLLCNFDPDKHKYYFICFRRGQSLSDNRQMQVQPCT